MICSSIRKRAIKNRRDRTPRGVDHVGLLVNGPPELLLGCPLFSRPNELHQMLLCAAALQAQTKKKRVLRNRIDSLSGVPRVGGGQETKSPARETNHSQGPGTRYDRCDFAR